MMIKDGNSTPPSNDADSEPRRRLATFGRRLLRSAMLPREAAPRGLRLVPRETPPRFAPSPEERARLFGLAAAGFDALMAEEDPDHELDPATLLVDDEDPLVRFVPEEPTGIGPSPGWQERIKRKIREIEDRNPPTSRPRLRRPSKETP